MPISLTGFVRYTDDNLYFRQVMLQLGDDDSLLDDPRWVVEGCDTSRPVALDKFPLDQPETWPSMDGTA